MLLKLKISKNKDSIAFVFMQINIVSTSVIPHLGTLIYVGDNSIRFLNNSNRDEISTRINYKLVVGDSSLYKLTKSLGGISTYNKIYHLRRFKLLLSITAIFSSDSFSSCGLLVSVSLILSECPKIKTMQTQCYLQSPTGIPGLECRPLPYVADEYEVIGEAQWQILETNSDEHIIKIHGLRYSKCRAVIFHTFCIGLCGIPYYIFSCYPRCHRFKYVKCSLKTADTLGCEYFL